MSSSIHQKGGFLHFIVNSYKPSSMRKQLRFFLSGILICAAFQYSPAQNVVAEEPDDSSPENLRSVTFHSPHTERLNIKGKAEAYPFLSADGLRLYFTSDREGPGTGNLFISTRKTIYDPFDNPKILDAKLMQGYYAGTFTGDELTVYMHKDGNIYVARRNSLSAPFSEPEMVKGISDNDVFAPAISPDGKELIVVANNNPDITLTYRKIRYNEFEKSDILPIPAAEEGEEKSEPGPGQFSKDGLSYYFSLENNGKTTIWRYSRPKAGDRFVDLEKMSIKVNGLPVNTQPAVNGDGSILIYVSSPSHTWEDDDLVLVNDLEKQTAAPEQFTSVQKNENNPVTVKSKLAFFQTKTYPNPFQGSITFEMNELPGENITFFLYDLSGRIIKQQPVNGIRTTISLDNISPATYVYQVLDKNRSVIASGKLVKQ